MSISLPPADVIPAAAQKGSAASFEEKLNAAKSSQILVDYMKENKKSAIHIRELQELANNSSGSVPADVSSAAAYMVRHGDVFTAIETNDVPGADGLSGVWNFEWAAAGGLDGSAIEAIARMNDTFDRAIHKSAQITEVTTDKKTELDSSKQRPQN